MQAPNNSQWHRINHERLQLILCPRGHYKGFQSVCEKSKGCFSHIWDEWHHLSSLFLNDTTDISALCSLVTWVRVMSSICGSEETLLTPSHPLLAIAYVFFSSFHIKTAFKVQRKRLSMQNNFTSIIKSSLNCHHFPLNLNGVSLRCTKAAQIFEGLWNRKKKSSFKNIHLRLLAFSKCLTQRPSLFFS